MKWRLLELPTECMHLRTYRLNCKHLILQHLNWLFLRPAVGSMV
ncbi:unnamed protein product [Linum tenue]|uniref:Uncharacterized protein n=1 Tax=Linum tenue TaxID=586396 RepID=A0AAV0JP93_9ROSI|nr:unnamed protein product [Linum tenue]